MSPNTLTVNIGNCQQEIEVKATITAMSQGLYTEELAWLKII